MATRTGPAERSYTKQLKLLASEVGEVIQGYAAQLHTLPVLMTLLKGYAERLTPWARRVARRMLHEVDLRDRDAWRALGNDISAQLQQEIQETPVGDRMQQLLDEQVTLIQSIPLEAAERVQQLAVEARIGGGRAREIAAQLEDSTEVTRTRAVLIARTETARAASTFLQARCEEIGSTHYIWRTVDDGAVRHGHAMMEGTVCEWANPPAVDEGHGRIMFHHPGEIWNCRCYAEPIVNDPYTREKHLRR
jgi:SPP1 gp7 family putative phage head morphogenesis protein